MSRYAPLGRVCVALLGLALGAALVSGAALRPGVAHAGWRSLSGGFLPAFAGGVEFAISPDSRTVAFIADRDADDSGRIAYTRVISDALGTTELYSAQIFGGDERDLSGLGGAGYVGDTVVSEDGAWLVYTVQVGGRYDLRVSDGVPGQAPIRSDVYLPAITR